MVFLTRYLCIRYRVVLPHRDRSWKKEMQNRLSWHLYGRRRNCYALQKDAIRRSLRFSTTIRPARRNHINTIYSHRIAAGCAQHGVQYSSLMKAMYENNMALNRKTLSNLSIYEPRTFQSLCQFVKTEHSEAVSSGLASAVEPTPSGVITRDMIKKARGK